MGLLRHLVFQVTIAGIYTKKEGLLIGLTQIEPEHQHKVELWPRTSSKPQMAIIVHTLEVQLETKTKYQAGINYSKLIWAAQATA